jgi:hypothetical protein
MTIPSKDHPTYHAARLIYAEGSKTEQQLWSGECGFHERADCRAKQLERAIALNWLQRLPDGRIALADSTVEFFDTEPPKPKPKGQVAGPRIIDVMNRAAYKPARQIRRADAWDNSVRAIPSHYAKVRP